MARTGNAWSSTQIPSMVGTRAVVTGANGGLGFRTAAALAQHGADVTLACRDLDRGQDAADRIRATVPTAALEATPLDLADLASVRAFAERWTGPLDLLVNNAGVTARRHHRTADGFERQLGTNHLGHFALTGLLLPALRAADAARVVVVSSLGHKLGRIDLDDLQREHRFRFLPAYGQSKLANLLFVRELDRRLRAAGDPIIVAAAHPGIAATNLSTGVTGTSGWFAWVVHSLEARGSQSAADGALPSLYAATMPDVAGGDFFGPDGIGQAKGAPTRVGRSARARDDEMAARLWAVSEELTGVTFPGLPPAPRGPDGR